MLPNSLHLFRGPVCASRLYRIRLNDLHLLHMLKLKVHFQNTYLELNKLELIHIAGYLSCILNSTVTDYGFNAN